MNAYELANKLENKDRLWAIDENLMLNTCEMLRQQADRIAHLEMLVANRNEIIDKLDLTMPQIKERCEPLCKPSVCNCIKKELSDEEIDLKWWISSFEHLKALGGGISDEMETKLKEMKARLKKASEK